MAILAPTKRLDGGVCECGRPTGKCIKGDMPYCDAWEEQDCPSCGGSGVRDDECTCMDDTCCCLYPTPPVCSMCGGRG
jgi:hypothetical protein